MWILDGIVVCVSQLYSIWEGEGSLAPTGLPIVSIVQSLDLYHCTWHAAVNA